MPLSRTTVVDAVGLGIQDLHASGQLAGDQPLLRIDNRERARNAPFQFDAAKGRLHRTGCRAIPGDSESALYGLWEIKPEDQGLECPRCRPVEARADAPSRPEPEAAAEGKADAKTDAKAAGSLLRDDQTVDLLYGFLSVVSQFGGVLRERGQEYRRSRLGAVLGARVEKIYAEVNDGERRVLDALTASLGTLAVTLREIEGGINGAAAQSGGSTSASAPPDKTP